MAGERKLRCSLDWLSSDAPYGNLILVSNVTGAGELVLTATVGYAAADPSPADNTLVLKANTPAVTPPPPLVVKPPVVRPVFGKPVVLPLRPLAGRRFTFTLPVRRSDTGALLRTGRMVCDPSVAGRLIRHAESFTAGKARLTFVVPKTAKGKLLKVKIKITAGTQSATKITIYRVR